MGRLQTVVCVKHVRQEATEEWDESMPLPGDIVEGVGGDCGDESFIIAEARSELCAHLRKVSRSTEFVWLKVRRGEGVVKLRTCVVQDPNTMLQKRFTVRAASDERHVVILADMTFEECFELQEMSRRVVNLDFKGFHRKGMKYDWKSKVGSSLPDQRSTVVSSILFAPLAQQRCIDAATIRSMAWFSAAVSSGIPLVFINIQTEQIFTREKKQVTLEELRRDKHHNINAIINTAKGIRLWFLPGVAEVSFELTPYHGETLFGMDMKRTEEGFICISSVTKGTAADRAGLRHLVEQSKITHHLLVISRLQGKSLMPSAVDSEGLIHCCDNTDIKLTLLSAMGKADTTIRIHIMSWSDKMVTAPPALGAASLRPPID